MSSGNREPRQDDRVDAAEYVDFALDVLEQAGGIAMKYFRTHPEVTNKAARKNFDPVTRADLEIETFIREQIRQRYPGHGICGEEFGVQAGSSPLSWVIDPIDGTRGFLVGSPMWGMLLGLRTETECIAGFMAQPFTGDTFVGSDAGAFLVRAGERRRIATRGTQAVEDAVLCCTHRSMFRSDRERNAFDAVESACRFSRFGTDCYGCCLLAGGMVDLVVEADLAAYDIIPLIPIVEAAGGVVTDWEGGSAMAGGRIVAAANPALHARTLELLASNT